MFQTLSAWMCPRLGVGACGGDTPSRVGAAQRQGRAAVLLPRAVLVPLAGPALYSREGGCPSQSKAEMLRFPFFENEKKFYKNTLHFCIRGIYKHFLNSEIRRSRRLTRMSHAACWEARVERPYVCNCIYVTFWKRKNCTKETGLGVA